MEEVPLNAPKEKENLDEDSNKATIEEIESVISEKNPEEKKEVVSQSSNNEIDDDEEIGFPINDSTIAEDSKENEI